MRLNDLQRLMLGWDELHPYNALDLVEVRRPITAAEVQHAAEQERLLHGLGPARIDARHGICIFQPEASRVQVETIEPLPDESTEQTLERHMAVELNRRFLLAQDVPIRLAVVRTRPNPFVVFTYHHWLCDGLTGGYLFRRILARLLGIALDDEPRWVFADALDESAIFGSWHRWPFDTALAWELLREVVTSTTIYVPRHPDPFDPIVDVYLLATPPDALAQVRRTARANGGTVNDVLMAVVARAVDAVLPERRRQRWQRTLTLGNIVNMRPLASDALRHRAGNHLSFALMHCPPDLPRDFRQLIRHLHRQSARSKEGRYFLASLTAFRCTRLLWPWMPQRWRRSFVENGVRMTACLSNLVYPAEWYGPAWTDLLGTYWRGVPTGYTSPLLIGITTTRGVLTLQLTAHRSGYDAGQVQEIRRRVEEGLRADC